MTTFFKTKDEYLTFRAAWAIAVNTTYSITASHVVLYNILRNKPYHNGFTPITRVNKLKNGAIINHGLWDAIRYLKYIQKYAKQVQSKTADRYTIEDQYTIDKVTSFLLPFAGTVTIDMFVTLVIPDEPALFSNFGKTKEIAYDIIMGTFNPVSMLDIYNTLNKLNKVA